jgi:formylmethanofuran dehydrogenase subunit E
MAEKRSALELAALVAWKSWGSEWAMSTICSGCGEMKFCRGKRRAKMLCLDCHDQGRK